MDAGRTISLIFISGMGGAFCLGNPLNGAAANPKCEGPATESGKSEAGDYRRSAE